MQASSSAPVLLLDGGLGTTLQDHYGALVDSDEVDGAPPPHRPLWSSHLLITPADRATLLHAQTAFAAAGADIILTATYQASLEGFARTLVDDHDHDHDHDHDPPRGPEGISEADAKRFMRDSVGIARSAYDGAVVAAMRRGQGSVALSLGAYGAVMVPSQEYSGRYDALHGSVELLKEWHLGRLDVFMEREEVWSDIDMVAFETLPLLVEIEAVRQTMWMAQKSSADCRREKPFWISCVFPGNDLCLPDGSSVDGVVRAMLTKRENAALPFAIGINCTKIGKVVELLTEYEAAVKKMIEAGELGHSPALVLYPDGTKGEAYNTTTHEWEQPKQNQDQDLAPWDEMMFNIIQKARLSGVWSVVIAGGCCKTAPDDIKKLRQRIDEATD